MKSKVDDSIAGVIHVIPALTTYPRENPSFRVYVADKKTSTILDYYQYRLFLNETGDKDEVTWNISYRFKEFFKFDNMNYENYPLILEKLKSDTGLFESFINHFWGDGPRGNEFLVNKVVALNYVTCRMFSSDLYEYLDCVGDNYDGIDFYFGYILFVNYLSPKWEHAYYP